MKGEKLKGALAKAPREKAMERLSPGVYRGSKGGLVSQGGQAIQRQPQPQAPQTVVDAVSGMRQPGPLPTQASPEQIGQMIAGQPVQNMMYTMTPEEAARSREYFRGKGIDLNNLPPVQVGTVPMQMPQPSANMGGQYRLSPGVYGTREQAMQQMMQPINGLGKQGNVPPIDWSQMVNYPATMPQQPQQQQQQQMPTRQQLLRKF